MTEEERLLQAHLDANPNDWQCRLVLSDHLEEINDCRWKGFRALGDFHRYPSVMNGRWYWTLDTDAEWKKAMKANRTMLWWQQWLLGYSNDALPYRWLRPYSYYEIQNYDSRRSAENAAALAFALLRIDLQQELLNGVCV